MGLSLCLTLKCISGQQSIFFSFFMSESCSFTAGKDDLKSVEQVVRDAACHKRSAPVLTYHARRLEFPCTHRENAPPLSSLPFPTVKTIPAGLCLPAVPACRALSPVTEERRSGAVAASFFQFPAISMIGIWTEA